MSKVQFVRGNIVSIIGEVQWGLDTFEVNTFGVIEEDTGESKILVVIDEIDGASNVCLYVRRKFLSFVAASRELVTV